MFPPSPLLSQKIEGEKYPKISLTNKKKQKNSPSSLEFGHGSHACPGRFFATNVIKSILIPFLLDYDLRLPTLLADGQANNPTPKYNRILVLKPDRERAIELRRRMTMTGAAAAQRISEWMNEGFG